MGFLQVEMTVMPGLNVELRETRRAVRDVISALVAHGSGKKGERKAARRDGIAIEEEEVEKIERRL